MKREFVIAASVLLVLILIAGCASTPEPVPAPQPAQKSVKAEELREGVAEDGEYWYSSCWAKSKDMQMALDIAKHNARLELARHLTGSASVVYPFKALKTVKQRIFRETRHYRVYVLMSAPKDKNPKG